MRRPTLGAGETDAVDPRVLEMASRDHRARAMTRLNTPAAGPSG